MKNTPAHTERHTSRVHRTSNAHGANLAYRIELLKGVAPRQWFQKHYWIDEAGNETPDPQGWVPSINWDGRVPPHFVLLTKRSAK